MNSAAAADSPATFPLLDARGDAPARGRAHGEHFRDRVRTTFDFYLDDLFSGVALSRADIENRAQTIARLTEDYAPERAAEIRGIAAGAGLPDWQLFVLNARTEILNARVDECTALYFAESRLLAQNWDWVEPLEPLSVIIRHEREDGFRYLSFGEPGMVGKIGMNSAGVGVCLNILFAPHDLSGLPVHVLIGHVLNASDFADCRRRLAACGDGKASHLLVGAADGSGLSQEFFGEQSYAIEPVDGVLIHTNHCLGLGEAGRGPDLENSCARFDRATRMVAATSARDRALAEQVLLDTSGGENAIMRRYSPSTVFTDHRVGSCASIIMELAERRMHIRRGPGTTPDYVTLEV